MLALEPFAVLDLARALKMIYSRPTEIGTACTSRIQH